MLNLAKRPTKWNEKIFKKYIKEGRGSGIRKDYKPWINIQNISSLGESSRILGWKTERVQHFLSNNESSYFYILEWSDIVVDIREQFPLVDYKETAKIAENLGIKHPVDNESGFPYVLTTDFMVTVKLNGKEVNIARTIKPALELEKERVIEKFEIERRYWKNRNIDWRIITDNDIPKELVRNIEWIHSAYLLEDSYSLTDKQVQIIASIIYEKIQNTDLTIVEIGDYIDSEYNLGNGTGLYLIKHLISGKQIFMNMTNKLDLRLPAKKFLKIV